MKKTILLFLLAFCSLRSEAQVYDVRGAFILSASGVYLPGGWGAGCSADYCFTGRWSLGFSGLYAVDPSRKIRRQTYSPCYTPRTTLSFPAGPELCYAPMQERYTTTFPFGT